MTVNFSVQPQHESKFPFVLLEVEIEGGVAEPQELATIAPPNISGQQGVVLSGRCPIWLMANLAHHYHVCKWVATFDPRLGGGVVVSRHSTDAPQVGDVVPVPKSE